MSRGVPAGRRAVYTPSPSMGEGEGVRVKGRFLHPSAVQRSLFIIRRFFPPHPTLSHQGRGEKQRLSCKGERQTPRGSGRCHRAALL